MFYISLPYFYQNKKFNDFFKNYIYNHKEQLIHYFSIEYCYGAFPWSTWNGGYNTNIGKAVLVPEMEHIFNSTENTIRIDWSNCFLKEEDFYDIHENAVLKLLSNTGGVCEISNIDLMNYIINYDKNIKFIISNNFQLLYPFSNNLIKIFSEQENIDFISIDNLSGLDIDNIDKSKIEIIIKNCKCENEIFLQCCKNEQINNYDFTKHSNFYNCPKAKHINYLQEILPYYKQGYTHFKIMPNITNLNDFNINIITSFIKPEYIGECLIEYYRMQ